MLRTKMRRQSCSTRNIIQAGHTLTIIITTTIITAAAGISSTAISGMAECGCSGLSGAITTITTITTIIEWCSGVASDPARHPLFF
jgi:hypothetical protein